MSDFPFGILALARRAIGASRCSRGLTAVVRPAGTMALAEQEAFNSDPFRQEALPCKRMHGGDQR